MIQKRLLFLLALVVLVGLTTHAFAAGFADTVQTPYQTAFVYLNQKSVVQGYPDGTGRPYGLLNRAEVVKVLVEIQGTHSAKLEKYRRAPAPLPLFPDAPTTAWYGPYLEVAFEEGLITGYPDGTFRPAQLVRVEEATAMLLRAYGQTGTPALASHSSAIENRAGEWFTPYVNTAIDRRLVASTEHMRLGTAITRGQFFEMVYRLDSLEASNTFAFEESQMVATTGAASALAPTTVVSTSHSNYSNTVNTNSNSNQSGGSSIVTYNNNQLPPATTSSSSFSTVDPADQPFSISMPTLGITDLAVIHPEDALTSNGILAPLQHGVGHLYSYPGTAGKIMVYGHSSGYPWDVSKYTKIFRQINQLNTGDKIYVSFAGKQYTYEVTGERAIDAKDTSPFDDNGSGEELILYTCWPPDSITQRYIVTAKPV